MNNSFAKKDYVPNQHIGETKKMEIFEDAYTIAERKRKNAEDLHKGEAKEDTFIDNSGRKIPIKKLTWQTDQMLNEARSAIREEILTDNRLTNEGLVDNDGPTVVELKKDIRVEKNKEWHKAKSLWDYFNGSFIHRTKRKLGLYRYNPKLNAGAPENVKENRRRTKKEHEINNWHAAENQTLFKKN